MLNNERGHLWRQNNPAKLKVVKGWVKVLRKRLKNHEASSPEIVIE